jgi:futalosine hydrolase
LSTRHYDLAIQAGIAGSFNKQLDLGEVVIVSNDRFAQLGVDDDATFVDVFELGFSKPNNYPFVNGSLEPSMPAIAFKANLKLAQAVTVETASGNEQSITKMVAKYHPDIESMEGAAFYFCCMHMHLPCFQLRGISNYVEKRNKANWNIPLAVEQLNIALQQIINNSIL